MSRTGFHLPIPPLLTLCAAALAVLANALLPLPWVRSPLSDILLPVGGLVVLAAIALFATAIRAMLAARTTLDPKGSPDHLLTGGPFGISRNPIYLANVLLLAGIGLASGIAWFLLFALLDGFAIRKLAIDAEEKALFQKFGKRYRDYAKRVRRWI